MPVSVQFAGKPRTLKFDIPTYRALEDAMGGKTIGAIVGHLSQVSVNAFSATLWAGFKHEDPTLTEASVADAFSDYIEGGGKLSVIGKALNDAMLESGLLIDDDGEDEPTADVHTIELDRTRTVKFNLRAIRMLESAMNGTGIGTIYDQIGNVGINALTAALTVGLKAEDKHITFNLTTKMIERYIDNGGSVKKLARVVRRAIEATGVFKNDEADLSDETPEGNAKPEPVQA